ncbi:MAG: group II intron reverse transcriptase domain-containing protein [Deltaproteobacteria bacterium]|nr:group II intron reverse transcriptase domain-containing protein [Deltaproteobacteria bacterium]
MKRTNHLFEKIVDFKNLLLASQKALRRKRYKTSSTSFYFNFESELLNLQEELMEGYYCPQSYQVFHIREPKVRKIAAAHFRDRVVHHALCNVLEPLFEKRLIFDTYTCRVDKGTHRAIKRVQYFSRKYSYYLKWDIQKYFESIDHEILKDLLRRIIKDKRILRLLDKITDHPVPGNASGKGLTIGNLTSQHCANLYLGELDHLIKDSMMIKGYVRYMDDGICLSNCKNNLFQILENIRIFLDEKLKLKLKEKVTRIAPVTEGIPFLGFRIFPNLIRLQRRNLVRWRRKMRTRQKQYGQGFISEETLIASVQSMIAHISHGSSMSLRRKEIESLGSLA